MPSDACLILFNLRNNKTNFTSSQKDKIVCDAQKKRCARVVSVSLCWDVVFRIVKMGWDELGDFYLLLLGQKGINAFIFWFRHCDNFYFCFDAIKISNCF